MLRWVGACPLLIGRGLRLQAGLDWGRARQISVEPNFMVAWTGSMTGRKVKKYTAPKIDTIAWLGLLGIAGSVTGVRGCMTSEKSAEISSDLEFRTYIYEAADLIGAQPAESHALDFRFDFYRTSPARQIEESSSVPAAYLSEQAY